MENETLSIDDFGVEYFSSLDDSKISQAVAEIAKMLDLGSGSTNSINLDKLLNKYLKDVDSRMKINEILINTDVYTTDGFINIKSKRDTIESWSGFMKRFIDDFDKRFYPDILDNNNLLREKAEMKEYLDRLFYLHSMMVIDLF